MVYPFGVLCCVLFLVAPTFLRMLDLLRSVFPPIGSKLGYGGADFLYNEAFSMVSCTRVFSHFDFSGLC